MEYDDSITSPGYIFTGQDVPQDNPVTRARAKSLVKATRALGRKPSKKLLSRARGPSKRKSSKRGRKKARRNPSRPKRRKSSYRRKARRNPKPRRSSYRRKARRNPISVRSAKTTWKSAVKLPKAGDFKTKPVSKLIAGLTGILIPSAVGWGWNNVFYKIPGVSHIPAGFRPVVKDLSRITVKAAVGAGWSWGVAAMTKNSAMGRVTALGVTIAVVLDLIGTVFKYAIGFQSPFGKAIVIMGGKKATVSPTQSIMAQLSGFGEISEAVTTYGWSKAAQSPGGMRILRNPHTGEFKLIHTGHGTLYAGTKSQVLGAYHTIQHASFAGRAGAPSSSPFGEAYTVEAGLPWQGET